jgi:hypothetical protein
MPLLQKGERPKSGGTKGRTFRKRNPKRKILATELAKGKTMAEAGKLAGYKSTQSAYMAFRAETARGEMQAALSKAGWNPAQWVEKSLVPKLTAKKTLFFASNGIVMDKRVVEDQSTRLAADDFVARIYGVSQTIEHTGTITHELSEREKQEAVKSLEIIKAFDSSSPNPFLAEVVEEES